MNAKKRWRRNGICMLSLVLLVLTASCAGKETKPEPQAGSAAKSEAAAKGQDPLLAKPYRVIVVAEYETTAEVAKDYPTAARECQANTVWALQEKKAYQAVESGKASVTRREGALLVNAKVSDMRIVSGAARIWGGAFAGSSFMEIDLRLVDAATNATVREKKLSSANNPWAASWMGGSTDHSLPADMGKIVAEYVHSVIPK